VGGGQSLLLLVGLRKHLVVLLGPDLEAVSVLLRQGLEGEFFLVVLEESAQLKVILGVQVGLDSHVVLNQFEEFLLEFVDFLSHEEGVDEGEVGVREVAVVPHLLGHEKRAKDKRAPVGGLKRHLCESNQSVYVDETNDAAFGTIKRLQLVQGT